MRIFFMMMAVNVMIALLYFTMSIFYHIKRILIRIKGMFLPS